MIRKKSWVWILVVLFAAALGAAVPLAFDWVSDELGTRAMRNRLNADLFRAWSPNAAAYFEGKADANTFAARIHLNGGPGVVDYLIGFSDATDQAADLIRSQQPMIP